MNGLKVTRPNLSSLEWPRLPRIAQIYVAGITAAGAAAVGVFFPLTLPQPALFVGLLAASCLLSVWKVNLPIPLAGASTLSMSYTADVMALLLLGPEHAVIVASVGAWTQCTFKVPQPCPRYRTLFSTAAEAVTMAATGVVYSSLGGGAAPLEAASLIKPLAGAITTYFLMNTGLVAAAIALSTGRAFLQVWRDDFLWSAASFMVAGTAGAFAAVALDRGEHWKAVLMLAPVYFTYRTYQLVVSWLHEQRRHLADTRTLHEDAMQALRQALEAEQREQEARSSAEQANRLKDEFLAVASHELRTPLHAILGWADMLRSGRLEADRRDRAAHAIYDSARRQAQLIDELLDVARIMSGKLRLECHEVDLSEILRQAVEVVQPTADVKGIHVGIDADPEIGAVRGDGTRLQQVFWNLLSNGIKFTPRGGAVHIRARRARNIAEIVVTDTGEGITGDLLPSVFEPFRQADAATTRRHGGLGLGLSIVKHLVEAHGGTITAESGGAGCGASFTVRLPIATTTGDLRVAAPALTAICAASTLDTSLDGLAVLVVDDDADTLQVVAAHLEQHGARVHTAASASEALDILQRERMDVLLADLAMPGEDGYALIRKVRAMSRVDLATIPAAALTAFTRDEDRQRALHAGFQLHLAKPIDAGALVPAIAALGRLHVT